MTNKPMDIPKQLVWQAWKRVKAASGGPGVDGVSIKAFEESLSGNLYKLWNRMASGSYFPKPVKQVAIPKEKGTRYLGVPTVTDRIAQTVVLIQMEKALEPVFLDESYGARRGKSALDAVAKCRVNCWVNDFVIDLDWKSFFTTIDHQLLLKAVDKHAKTNWEKLYIRRWLEVPISTVTGEKLAPNGVGIPQGATISPLLSNLFLHYGFDRWMKTNYPEAHFERYLDDVVIHCRTLRRSEQLLDAIRVRLSEVKLALNEEKTQITYCRSGEKKWHGYGDVKCTFTFLGFEFKPRVMKTNRGKLTRTFSPAVGTKGKKRLRKKLRDLNAFRQTQLSIEGLSKLASPVIRGWINYFKAFRPSEMCRSLLDINRALSKWISRKYKCKRRDAVKHLRRIQKESPNLFPQWIIGYRA